ncbi:MAG: hypothetical protein ACK2TV_00145, partial [Anaerolineales bacterium]
MTESFTEVEETLQVFLDQITSILDINTNRDIRSFLKRFLQRSKSLLKSDGLCIYHSSSPKLDLFKLAAIEVKPAFPQILPLEDFTTPYKPDFWQYDQSPQNQIQAFAREAGFRHLSTFPRGQGQEFIGVLVVGAFQQHNDRLYIKKLQVISNIIENALQIQILKDALHHRSEFQNKFLDSRNLLFNHTRDGALLIDP